jgi:hypothetical protein
VSILILIVELLGAAFFAGIALNWHGAFRLKARPGAQTITGDLLALVTLAAAIFLAILAGQTWSVIS